MKKEQIYKASIKKWGEKRQFRKLQEEACELGAAINHYIDKRNNGENHLYEEFIDVEIMMEQMRPLLDRKKLIAAKRKKLKRLKNKIG